jgi:stage II sporulation protein D
VQGGGCAYRGPVPPSHQPHQSHGCRPPRVAGRLPAAALAVLLAAGLAAGGVAGLPVAPARAADCPPSGGAAIAPATAPGDVVFRGGGWGHGLGMSQYGAQGAARLGCSAEQILTRYYAGTQVVTRPTPARVRLRMLDDGYRVDVEAVQGALSWVLPGCVAPAPTTAAGPSPAPTPGVTPPPTVAPDPAPTGPPCPPAQPQGARWQLRLDDATHSQFVLWDLGVTPKQQLWAGGSATAPLRLQESGAVAHLTSWRGASIYLERWVRWDWTRFTVDGAVIDAVQQIDTTDDGSAMDKYLWGIAEVPASFPAAALEAQAVAARTYAAKRTDRVLMPTPADQNWTGWKKETEGTGGAWGLKWKAAVDATSGLVVADAATGALIDAFYSSSMGGHTEDERYVWGVEAPFLRAVDDSAWDAASSNPAGKRSWATGVSWATLAARLGFSSISTVSVPPRGAESRVAGVKVVGIKGGALTTSYVEGWDVREALGLLSPGFTIAMRRTGGRAAQPLVGDWDGDGRDQVGWFRRGRVALMMTSPAGSWVKRFRYGTAGDVAVVGDWDGDGDDDLGVFRSGRWLLRAGLTGGAPTRTVVFGRAGDRPVVGSWTGRRLGLGVVRGRSWLLRRSLTSGAAQHRFRFGRTGDVPVVGSWNGTARTAIGVERDGRWLLRNRRSAGPAGIVVTYGAAADRAVVGDWDGDGTSTPGIVRGRSFVLRIGLGPDATTRRLIFRG